MLLKDKVVFITGSTKGIGLSIAEKVASEGATIVINSRNQADVDKTVETLMKKYSVAVKGIAGDMSKEDDVKKAYTAIIEEFSKLDILINNAGVTRDNLILRMKEEDWQTVMDINLKSVFLTSKTFLKSILKTGGKIINISSVVGEVGNPGQTNYAASKGGMISFTKSLAREVASRNVTVNVVSPGYIETDMTATLTEEMKQKLFQQIPLKRLGTASDIASSVCFLAGPGGDYITGQVLSVNGGLSM